MGKKELDHLFAWMKEQEEINKGAARCLKAIEERLTRIEEQMRPHAFVGSSATGTTEQPLYISGEKWIQCRRCKAHHPEGQWCLCRM